MPLPCALAALPSRRSRRPRESSSRSVPPAPTPTPSTPALPSSSPAANAPSANAAAAPLKCRRLVPYATRRTTPVQLSLPPPPLTPTPTTPALPSSSRRPMPKPSANAKRGGFRRPSSMPLPSCPFARWPLTVAQVTFASSRPAPSSRPPIAPIADAVHPSPSRRAPSAADADDVCPRKRGAASAAPLECRCLVSLAGYRRADHVDLDSPSPALCRQLCSRRRPPQRLVAWDPRGRGRGDDHAVVRARRARAAANRKELCKRKEGRLPPPLLNAVALCPSRLPSRRSRRPRESSSRSVPTALTPTPSNSAPPVALPPLPMPTTSAQTKEGRLPPLLNAVAWCAFARWPPYRRAGNVDLERPALAPCRHL